MRKKRKNRNFFTGILTVALVFSVLIWFFTAVGNLKNGQSEQGRQQLETAIRRAAVACYAVEGVYPPDLTYITEHYGVQIEDCYIVFYDIFADNIMPDITVLEKK